jgi:cytochrome d ubiquinol oxidase subunit I
LLSLLANRTPGSFVPGIKDLVYGNKEENIMGVEEKIRRGKLAVEQLALYKKATREGATPTAESALARFDQNKAYLGFGYLQSPEEAVPPVSTVFYAFHIMVILGGLFLVLFFLFLLFSVKNTLVGQRWLLILGSISVFLGFVAGQCGWIVAEVGRQPWAIQNLLPVSVARSNLTAGTVQTTFFMFLAIFTILLVAEIGIMLKQIKMGPEGE